MPLSPPVPAALDFAARVAQVYAELMARPGADPDAGLGGRLFYAGEMDAKGRALVVAANIAGAATLAASADRVEQKQAVRDGIADFLVNSLDEALRILKNQLRKRESVAVCVVLEPAIVEREIEDRGVAPDFLRRDVPFATPGEVLPGEQEGRSQPAHGVPLSLVVWRAASAAPKDLARLDAIALDCLAADDWAARRWLRLAPRYLGRMAHGARLLASRGEFAVRFAEQLEAYADRGDIAFPYEVSTCVLSPLLR